MNRYSCCSRKARNTFALTQLALQSIKNEANVIKMELKEFIKQTLLSIVSGVEEANEEVDRFRLSNHKHYETGENGQKIGFDVSITVKETSKNNVSGGIKVALVNLNGGRKASESNQNVHKIQFEVFVKEK